MEDRKIIELYNYRSENALIETDKTVPDILQPYNMSPFQLSLPLGVCETPKAA